MNTVTNEVTEDKVLGGRLRIRQPRRGHRVGHDAILLAAAVPARPAARAVELGAGVGAAALALAARVPEVDVTLVEIDPMLAALAQDNIALNGFADRLRIAICDVTDPTARAAAGLAPGSATQVLMNPPFHDPARQNASPDPNRARAHVARPDGLRAWISAARHLLAPDGDLTLIWRADGLGGILQELESGFGAVTVMPVHPGPGRPAIRVLVRAVRNSRAPLAVAPGLVLNTADGRPAPEAEAILRHGASLMPNDAG